MCSLPYVLNCALCIVHCALYTVHCTLFIVHCEFCIVHCTLYIVLCLLCIVHLHCALCIVHFDVLPSCNVQRNYRGLFSLTCSFRLHYGLEIDSASNGNEYHKYLLRFKAAGA